jgi:hypothetical protein
MPKSGIYSNRRRLSHVNIVNVQVREGCRSRLPGEVAAQASIYPLPPTQGKLGRSRNRVAPAAYMLMKDGQRPVAGIGSQNLLIMQGEK